MMAFYLSAWGLSSPPFDKDLDDKELWLPPSKESLVDAVLEALLERQCVILTGEPGTGKTCLTRAVRHRCAQGAFRLTYCHNATLGRRDFYRQLCLALGLPMAPSAAGLFYAISSHVKDLSKEHLHPVFLLDEAHLLHQDTLDHLHILLNYEWDQKPLLSLLLMGLPDLMDQLSLRRNRSLLSRIHTRLTIGPLEPEDTTAYVRMRLARCGCDRELFTSDALAFLHEASLGQMRDIDRLATASLRLAARAKRRLVERDHVLRAVQTGAPSEAA
jgi:type II secretory pathway predicted ATPase ExeA